MTRTLCALLACLLMSGPVQAASRVFYDGFESGNTNLWAQDDYRNRCQVVSVAADALKGPFAGSKMAQCNHNGTVAYNVPNTYETLTISPGYGNEVLYRVHFRADANVLRAGMSGAKLTRVFNPANGMDMFNTVYNSPSLRFEGFVNNTQFPTYWGVAGDATADAASWHKLEIYANHSAGVLRAWHDGVLIKDVKGAPFSAHLIPFNLMSNWAETHGAVNYFYFDEVEVFSDAGTGATGLLSDATVQVAVVVAPPPVDPAIAVLQAQVAALQAQGATDKATIAALQAKIAQAKTDLQ